MTQTIASNVVRISRNETTTLLHPDQNVPNVSRAKNTQLR